MSPLNVMPAPKFFAVNASGTPYAGGFLYFFASGTTTPLDTYSDATGTPNAHPVVLDSAGRATVFLAPAAYAVELQDSNHVQIWTVDPVTGYSPPEYGFNVQSFGAVGNGLADDTAAITAAMTAATLANGFVYFPEGTYLTTLQTFPAGARTRWIGAGRQKTIVKVADSSGTAISAVYSHLTSEWAGEISAMTIDGNGGTGPLVSITGGILFLMRDVVLTNVDQTGLRLVSCFDCQFDNVYVEVCGDSTHPCVVLDTLVTGIYGNSANKFINLHIENGPGVDATMLDLVGFDPAILNVSSNIFVGFKAHGGVADSFPNRPVVRIGANASNNHFYDAIIASGKGTSQVEITGDFNHFYSPQLAIGATVPPQCAFDLIGGGNRILNALIGGATHTVTYFRNAGNENVVLYPRVTAGPVVYTNTGQITIRYRDPATGYEISFETLGQRVNSFIDFGSRVSFAKGVAVAAANDLAFGFGGNLFHITGATQINAVTTSFWQAGSEITLIFDSTPTVKHNTAGGAGTAVILLAGAADFVASANDVLTLVYDGTSWYETGRTVI
jgi:hypothetical protein